MLTRIHRQIMPPRLGVLLVTLTLAAAACGATASAEAAVSPEASPAGSTTTMFLSEDTVHEISGVLHQAAYAAAITSHRADETKD